MFVNNYFRKIFSDASNLTVVRKLEMEVKGQDEMVTTVQVRGKLDYFVYMWKVLNLFCIEIADAARRFFQSKLEESSLKQKGTYTKKVQSQRRRNRIVKVCNTF